MELLLFALITLFLAWRFSQTQDQAASEAIRTIDEVVMNLQHRPSKREKKALKQIVKDDKASFGEKMLADTLVRMRHQVEGTDATKLIEFRNDAQAPAEERELADILLRVSSQPSGEVQQRLEKLVQA